VTGFLDIERVIVPQHAALEVQDFLRQAGRLGCEGFAVWAGQQTSDTEFRVIEAVIPDQRPIRMHSGIMVMIGPQELHRLNVWLHENNLTVIAQIHSHPTEAYHSEADDHLAIATVVGSFSFVVPDFAAAPFSLATWAPYRLSPDGLWRELDGRDVERILMLVD
jgi:hypothetical protein